MTDNEAYLLARQKKVLEMIEQCTEEDVMTAYSLQSELEKIRTELGMCPPKSTRRLKLKAINKGRGKFLPYD